MDRTEQLIVERLKANDEKAWHFLFDRHYPVLCHIASQYVHDDFLAETIVGDVILHLQHWVSTKCPFAGRGPCGRPHPRWEIGYPAMADGHKGRTLQEDRNVHGGPFGLSCVVSAIYLLLGKLRLSYNAPSSMASRI